MIELKQHDTARVITDTLLLGGLPIPDLATATLKILFRNKKLGTVVKKDANIVDAPTAKVEYTPVVEDVEVPGLFDIEWEVTFADLTQLTIPTHGYGKLKINPDLG